MLNAMRNWGGNVRETGSDLIRALLSIGQQPIAQPVLDEYGFPVDGNFNPFAENNFMTLGTGTGGPAVDPGQFTRMQSLFGGTAADGSKTMGAVPSLLQGGAALGNLYMGMKNYGLAKDSLKESRRQFDLNYGAQRDSLNTYMEDRQNARNAASPGQHMSTAEYMERNRIR